MTDTGERDVGCSEERGRKGRKGGGEDEGEVEEGELEERTGVG